ncbi:hypothetical protein Tsubulata_009983 [Turnera subulata]|uniref:Protein kinase domain-containing protein n=1 Tax=Turnera subulata TaxID=218843 RepID=A0A9Q0JIH5_9ROSI|nr:hypothetical protein Tsubulata_009983 [Turnera subulata]
MARNTFLPYLLPYLLPALASLLARAFASAENMYPLTCSHGNNLTCNALLYHFNSGLPIEEVSSFYNVGTSKISTISRANRFDYLITVPCSCKNVNGTTGYFYDTLYRVKEGDIFFNVSAQIFDGQAWRVGDEEHAFIPGNDVPIHLLCGCVETDSQVVVTYTVEEHDTLSDIGALLSATTANIQKMNMILAQNPGFIDVGWVLFVPKELNGIPPPKRTSGTRHKWAIIISILSAVTLVVVTAMILVLLKRNRRHGNIEEGGRAVSKSLSTTRASSLQSLYKENNMEDGAAFDSERPVIYSIEEIEEATSNFDETKKIGEGGYGSVYFGLLGDKEVAIKKMRSNKSKEFFAELKVLCKIHHINVVELLGFASGDDHLYLVYEYVRNGSLSEHLHDPLLKGHQPVSWTARAQIALDAAKGIEYIHDHTKARYVHRDIKTTNILLDEGLRAKVADFGLAKLVERTDDEDLIATRLVGTPGYLPPESVKELQVNAKTDVFAFGVVLAELITGQRALVRDSREPAKMKSLISVIYKIFEEEDPESALEAAIDINLGGSYPIEDVCKMAEIADWCLSEAAVARPEMRDIVPTLSQIMTSSVEWEASLGGSSQVFSGVFSGR